jgi:hypothetical protein
VYFFQVFVHRELSPEKGQEALAQIMQEVTKQQGGVGFQTVKVEGANRSVDPFPEWLKLLFATAKLEYDTVNFCYQKEFRTLSEAEQYRTWFDQEFRPYLKAKNFADDAFIQSLHVRVMEDTADVAGLTSF